MSKQRKLAAILFADIEGYTAAMQKDEEKASLILHQFQSELEKQVASHQGQVINFYGDGALCTFGIPIDAVRCALALQTTFLKEPRVPVRIGIHSGTVTLEGGKAYGNSVNITSRIESMGVAGAILFSKKVRDEIKNHVDLQISALGSFTFKNVEEPIELFALVNEGLAIPSSPGIREKGMPVIQKTRQWTLYAFIALAIMIMAGIVLMNSGKQTTTSTEMNAIAVFPFEVKGSPDIEYLGEGMVDLISARLDEIPGMTSVDPNRIFSELENIQSISRKPQQAANLAGIFGAAKFILGSIIEIDETVEITATKYDANGEKITATTVDGSKDGQIASAVEQLIRTLVAEEMKNAGLELSQLAALTSGNMTSLKAYLEGEQAFRKGQYVKAYELYSQATEYDSTFALAWMGMREAGVWNLQTSTFLANQQWAKYVHLMPEKWQDYHQATKFYGMGDRRAIELYHRLNRKYGETRAFVNGLAEFLFHYNPVFGKPFTEAKPYLERTLELDQHNMEAIYHLGDIALYEADTQGLESLLKQVGQNSELFPLLKIYQWVLLDSIPDQELDTLMQHPNFIEERLASVLAPRRNKPINFQLLEKMLSKYPSPEFQAVHDALKDGLAGREGDAFAAWDRLSQVNSSYRLNYKQWSLCIPATQMISEDFLPMIEKYAELYQQVKQRHSPWEIYAATKYAMALDLKEEVVQHKERLDSLALAVLDQPHQLNRVKYYQNTIKAFEAYKSDNQELALQYLDTAAQYPFGLWEILNAQLDATMMKASIYAQRGEFDKAIPYFENLPAFFGTTLMQGYATYQLSQWYEQIGDRDNALIKCDLLLNDYQNCDEKYKPWVSETERRRARLISLMH